MRFRTNTRFVAYAKRRRSMNLKVPLVLLGFLIVLLLPMTAALAQAAATVDSSDIRDSTQMNTQQTAAAPEVVAVPIVSTPYVYVRPIVTYVPRVTYVTQRIYVPIASTPPAAYPVVYRRIYRTPLRDAMYGRYRVVATPVWYPLRN